MLMGMLSVAPVRASVELIVPAYFYPAGEGLAHWNALNLAAARVGLNVILNVDSGPGKSVDPNYQVAVQALRAAGGRVFGYLHTSWGKRDAALLKKDIDAYLQRYPVDGFFIDEMASGPEALDYYAGLYDYIKAREQALLVIGNPGVVADPAYLQRPVVDVLMHFEGDGETHARQRFPEPDKGVQGRLGEIVHGVTEPQMEALVAEAGRRGLGMLYLTDDLMPNPYDVLPRYWQREVALVAAMAVPAPGSFSLLCAGVVGWLASRRKGGPA